jgi:hypothetical protein
MSQYQFSTDIEDIEDIEYFEEPEYIGLIEDADQGLEDTIIDISENEFEEMNGHTQFIPSLGNSSYYDPQLDYNPISHKSISYIYLEYEYLRYTQGFYEEFSKKFRHKINEESNKKETLKELKTKLTQKSLKAVMHESLTYHPKILESMFQEYGMEETFEMLGY